MADPRRRRAAAERASFAFQISRTTLTRAGLKLHSFTSCVPALRNYKALYFDILRALQERQEVIVDSEILRGSKTLPCRSHDSHRSHAATDRVSRLLMPLSTWLVIHQGDSSFSATESSDRDTTPPLRLETSHTPGKSIRPRRLSATAHPVTAPEELMPRTLLPHLFHCLPPLPGTGH